MKKSVLKICLFIFMTSCFYCRAEALEIIKPSDEMLRMISIGRDTFDYLVSVAKSNEYEAMTRLNLKGRERLEIHPKAVESAIIFSNSLPPALKASLNNLNSRPALNSPNIINNAAVQQHHKAFQAAVGFNPGALPGEGRVGGAETGTAGLNPASALTGTGRSGPGVSGSTGVGNRTAGAGGAGQAGNLAFVNGGFSGGALGAGNSFGNRATGAGGWGAAALAASRTANRVASTASSLGFGARGATAARNLGTSVGVRTGAALGARGSGLRSAASFGASAGARAGSGRR